MKTLKYKCEYWQECINTDQKYHCPHMYGHEVTDSCFLRCDYMELHPKCIPCSLDNCPTCEGRFICWTEK